MTTSVESTSSRSHMAFVILFRGELTASLIADLVAAHGLGPLSNPDALEVIGGHAAMCFPDAAVTKLLETEFRRHSARVSHMTTGSAGGRVIVRWARGGRKGIGVLDQGLAANEALRATAEELKVELATSRRRTEMLLQLVEACGLTEDPVAVLTALEDSDVGAANHVREWLRTDGSRWMRRSSGAAELWLDL